ncbi:MAG: branched-chain amino acid ABC transporter permease [Streptosporangiales bacterium]|nr:branched-chain amino acid ABC transporter permease [Streptosporangiales bacterium]
MSQFLQYLVNGLTIGAFLSLTALGYTMIYGIIRLINFAHGDIFMVGAFAGYTVLVAAAAAHVPVALIVMAALVAGMLFTGLLGVVVERVAYQPLLSAPRLAILISALGASLALEESARLIFGAGFSSYPHLLPTAGFGVAGVRLTYAQVGMFVMAVLLMVGLYLFVHRTMLGTAMRALAMDRDAARLMGINVERIILLTFFLGSVLAGAAGVMQGLYYTQINFIMGFLIGLRAFTAAVLGGIGNIPGAMVAGLLIGLLQSFAAAYVSARWTDALVFCVLILVLVVKPTGLFGERIVERV